MNKISTGLKFHFSQERNNEYLDTYNFYGYINNGNNFNKKNNNNNFEDRKFNDKENEKEKEKEKIMSNTYTGFYRNNNNNNNNIAKFNNYLNENNNLNNKSPLILNTFNTLNTPKDKASESYKDMFNSMKIIGYEYKRNLMKQNNNNNIINNSNNNINSINNPLLPLESHNLNQNQNNFFDKIKINNFYLNKPKTSYELNRNNNNINKSINQKESDIFCLKNDYNSLKKIGEKYLIVDKYNNNNQNPSNNTYSNNIYLKSKEYSSTTNSNSNWSPKNNVLSLINYGSTEYDIISSNKKRVFEGKNYYIKSYENLNENKLAYKQKSISEICDLNKIAMPNFQKNYSDALKNNPKIFNKTVNLCNSFNNLFGEYKGSISRPFKND